jgi:hypothetical protein
MAFSCAMPATLDTRKAHLVRHHGDLVAIYTWINDERALVLVPRYRAGAAWFVVCESAAYTWDDSDPRNIGEVIRKSTKACEVLGIEPTPWNCQRVASIIIDGLPDLISMPSAPGPEYYRGSFGRMELRADGTPIAAEDIRVEKEGVTYG